MSDKISSSKAKAYINNYRKGLPAGALRSAWIDRSFIDAILSLNATHNLDGIRVYMAKYTEDDPQGRFSSDSETIIIVPTENGGTEAGTDIDEAYFDYSRVCPPYCSNDGGSK